MENINLKVNKFIGCSNLSSEKDIIVGYEHGNTTATVLSFKATEGRHSINSSERGIYQECNPFNFLNAYQIAQTYDEVIQQELNKFPSKYWSTIISQMKCSKVWSISHCSDELCPEFNKEVLTTYHCGTRYCCCINCTKLRYAKARTRIESIIPEYYRKLLHLQIGSNQHNKKDIELKLNKIWNYMRKTFNYKINYVRVFDIGDDHLIKGAEKQENVYNHFHYALFLEKGIINYKEFNSRLRIAIDKYGDGLVFSNFGIKKRVFLIDYFSKRDAGMLGHKKDGYIYYTDIMSRATYFNEFYNKKFVAYNLPVGLTCISVPSPSFNCCSSCGNPLKYDGWRWKTEQEVKPPD